MLNNTIAAENVAPARPDVDDSSEKLSGSYNLVGNGAGQSSLVDGEDGNQVGDLYIADRSSVERLDPIGQWSMGLLSLARQPGDRCRREWIGCG